MSRKQVGQPAYNLSEAQVRYAMQNTSSARQAAAWLHVDYKTFRKYALLYKDYETGISLFEMQKKERSKKLWVDRIKTVDETGAPKKAMTPFTAAALQDIFDGKYPKYPRAKLVKRMLHEGLIAECCDNCGYCTRREYDLNMPLKLWYRNGDDLDLSKDNLRLLCFNCYYILAFPERKTLAELKKNSIYKKK